MGNRIVIVCGGNYSLSKCSFVFILPIFGDKNSTKLELWSDPIKKGLQKVTLLVSTLMTSHDNAGDCRRLAEENLDFSTSDIEGIEDVSKQQEVFSLLTCSLCPTIYGHNMVKVFFTVGSLHVWLSNVLKRHFGNSDTLLKQIVSRIPRSRIRSVGV